jgi:hypothetical protein
VAEEGHGFRDVPRDHQGDPPLDPFRPDPARGRFQLGKVLFGPEEFAPAEEAVQLRVGHFEERSPGKQLERSRSIAHAGDRAVAARFRAVSR